jgi:hypothetical protein
MTVMHCSTACFDGKVPDMSDDPLGLVDRSADHNDIVDVLLGARELVQRFAALALEPDALAAAPDERVLALCLGVCAVRDRLLRWIAIIESPVTPDSASSDRGHPPAGTLLR